MHRHSFYEIHFVLEGTISYEFECGENFVDIYAGSQLVILPGTVHRIAEASKGCSVFKLAFFVEKPSEIMEYAKNKTPGYFTGEYNAFVKESVDFIISQAINEKFGFDEAIKSQLSAFVIYVLQSLPVAWGYEHMPGIVYADNDDRVRIVKQIIKDNLKSPLKSDDIARQLNISIRHLNRLIKKSDNLNLAELIRRMRIDEAKRLLAGTNFSIEEIAEMTGISGANILIRVFKSLEGCTPGQYRKDIKT